MLYRTRTVAKNESTEEFLRILSSYKTPKKKNVFEMIGSGISTTLNIISNTAKTIENCSEMMCKATTQMNKAMYNKLSPEAKAEFDARMAELHIDVSKYKNK